MSHVCNPAQCVECVWVYYVYLGKGNFVIVCIGHIILPSLKYDLTLSVKPEFNDRVYHKKTVGRISLMKAIIS